MTREQYRRANKVVFPVMLIILGYLFVAMGLAVFAGTAEWYTYLEMGASLLALLVVIIIFLAKKDTKLCGICMMGAGAFVYLVFRLLAYPRIQVSMHIQSFLPAWPTSMSG